MSNNLSRSVFRDDDPLTAFTRRTSQHFEAGTESYEANLREQTEAAQAWQNSSPVPAGVQRVMPASPNMGQPITVLDPSNLFNGGSK
jgi:hypothetical protein